MPASRTPLLLSIITLLLLAALIHSAIRLRSHHLADGGGAGFDRLAAAVADPSPLSADAAALYADFLPCADPDFRRHVQLRPRAAGF